MWTTAKTVAAEIRRDHVSYIKKLSDIDKRLSTLEQSERDFQDQFKADNLALMEKINSIQEELKISGRETRVGYNAVLLNTQKAKAEIIEAITEMQEHESVVTENIVEINSVLQETLRELMSLDDANRLIIARLLLKDMEF